MATVPPLYDQVREGSARLRARDRALAWLGRPPYHVAAGGGALLGVASGLATLIERRLPSLVPVPPLTTRQLVVGVLVRAASGAAIALTGAALLRFARWTYFRTRVGARAT